MCNRHGTGEKFKVSVGKPEREGLLAKHGKGNITRNSGKN
jgi:hypothetical protein